MSPYKKSGHKCKENTSCVFSTVCLMEPLGSVQEDEEEQRTAEEQALSDTFSTVTQVPLTTREAPNIRDRCCCCGITNRLRSTAFCNHRLPSVTR